MTTGSGSEPRKRKKHSATLATPMSFSVTVLLELVEAMEDSEAVRPGGGGARDNRENSGESWTAPMSDSPSLSS